LAVVVFRSRMLFLYNFYSLYLFVIISWWACRDGSADHRFPAPDLYRYPRVAVDRLWSGTVREYGTQSPWCSLSPISSGFEPTKRWASISLKDPPPPPQHPKSSGYLNLSTVFILLSTDPGVRVRFPALPNFLRSSGSGTGSTQPREYNWGASRKKSSGSGLVNRYYGRRDPSRWPRGTLYPQKLALTSPTSCGHSVSIVRSRT
jgi:hypothetical protein